MLYPYQQNNNQSCLRHSGITKTKDNILLHLVFKDMYTPTKQIFFSSIWKIKAVFHLF